MLLLSNLILPNLFFVVYGCSFGGPNLDAISSIISDYFEFNRSSLSFARLNTLLDLYFISGLYFVFIYKSVLLAILLLIIEFLDRLAGY